MDEVYKREQDMKQVRCREMGTPFMKRMIYYGLLEGVECWGFIVFNMRFYNGEEGEVV
jgi:hypothetical protein